MPSSRLAFPCDVLLEHLVLFSSTRCHIALSRLIVPAPSSITSASTSSRISCIGSVSYSSYRSRPTLVSVQARGTRTFLLDSHTFPASLTRHCRSSGLLHRFPSPPDDFHCPTHVSDDLCLFFSCPRLHKHVFNGYYHSSNERHLILQILHRLQVAVPPRLAWDLRNTLELDKSSERQRSNANACSRRNRNTFKELQQTISE